MNTIAYIIDFVWTISFGLYVLLAYKLDGGKDE